MKLNRTTRVIATLCSKIRGVSLFLSWVTTKIKEFSSYSNACLVCALTETYAKYIQRITRVCAALILRVKISVGFTKIFKTVVAFVCIAMVDLVFRPFTGYIKPSKSVGQVSATIDLYSYITVVFGTGYRTHSNFFAECDKPHKYPSFWIVIQQFVKAIWCKLGGSHGAAPIGQVVRAELPLQRFLGPIIIQDLI